MFHSIVCYRNQQTLRKLPYYLFISQITVYDCVICCDNTDPGASCLHVSRQDNIDDLLSGVPDYFDRNKISSGGDLSHYSSASLY